MKFYLTAVFLFVTFITSAQFSDDFTDGDFTDSPTWTGITDNFEINDLNQLHLLAPEVEDTSYLSVATTEIDNTTWDFWLRMDFNPSSGNYTRVYLVSDQENLKGSLNGYFVFIGNTADEISLYRQDGTSITKIIDGLDDLVDVSDVNVRIRVTRDDSGNWELLRDATGGFAFESEGAVFDDTYTATAYFGVFCKYTSSRSDLFYFDELGSPYTDGTAPTLETVTALSATTVDVTFSEPVDEATATTPGNYSIDGGIGTPSIAELDLADPALVHLTVVTPFVNGTTYELEVTNVEDLDGNVIESPATESFLYFIPEIPEENDIIFTEIFPDPNPVIGLPEAEFIEIYNRSDKIFDLAGWTINDNTNTGTFETYILEPDSYLVLCSSGNGALFGITNVLEVASIPTLTNSGDYLVLKSDLGLEIDSINYDLSWYHDTDKDDGGWSIEREHLNSPCSDYNNWAASLNENGGTPGVQNSVWTDEDDVASPWVSDLSVISPEEIVLSFNESMDTTVDLLLEFTPSLSDFTGEFSSLLTYQVNVMTLEESQIYNLTVSEGTDCWGNEITSEIQFGLPAEIEPEDIILNEIMFNPLTGGSDYVELYNASEKIIDLNELWLANWDDDTVSNFEQVSLEQYLLLPGEYALVTEDSTDIINDFPIYGIGRFVQTDLPTYPNDSGTVYLFRSDSIRIDYFHYDEDFHFDLLTTEDGKALERISFGGGMNNPDNWHTASEAVDWGTPGYLNSQSAMPVSMGEINLDPQLFSPDNDGYNDVLIINFDLTDTDNVLDVVIFDNQGRQIRQLKENFFIGQQGFVIWDGINDEGTKAEIGTYIVWVSVKNSQGLETIFKEVAVLGGQL